MNSSIPPVHRAGRWRTAAATLLALAIQAALASPQLTQFHSFGFAELSAADPYGPVLFGRDGLLYGTTSAGGQNNQGTVFQVKPDGSGFRLLKTFGVETNDGARPFAALLEGSDGALYGTTEEGGQFGFGTVFHLDKDGSNYSILKSFSGGPDGAYPEAGLLEGSDGLLYGCASGGGTNDAGVVFRLDKDGTGFQSLVQFSGTNGANPEAGLIEASDGLLYGTTYACDSTNLGTVFRVQKDGGGFAVLMRFLRTNTSNTNGAGPQTRLVEGPNGALYGTTSAGGTNGTGTIFELNKDGTGFATVYHFGSNSSQDGRIPLGSLLLASDGLFYGTTYDGGTNGNGVVFSLNPAGTPYTVVASLTSPQGPACGLVEGTNGSLYGTTQLGGSAGDGSVFALQKDGAGFSVLESFSATGGDGKAPYSAPIAANNDSLYGTTRAGGSSAAGTLYSLSFYGPGYQLVSSFDQNAGGPMSPLGPLLQATNDVLYGVTQFGGSSNSGTIFSTEQNGSNFSVLYASTNNSDGHELRGGLIQSSSGAIYGLAVYGGSGSDGTAFRVNADGTGYAVLKNFAFGSTGPGANPLEALLEASDGKLYGTTYAGGMTNRGVIFSLAEDGSSYTLLKAFGSPATDGENPMSPLLEGSDGMLYGSAYGGGGTNSAGTLFGIHKDGTGFRVLVSFVGLGPDGRHPCGNLVEWTDGALYGTTERGGINDQGTLFRVNKDGSGYAVLANFGGALGTYPRGGLVRGPDGALYGTTDQGGGMGLGTVFRYGPAFGDLANISLVNQLPSLTGLGLPGTNYVLERSLDLGPAAAWAPLLSTNAPANGQFSFIDQSAPLTGAFYRLVH